MKNSDEIIHIVGSYWSVSTYCGLPWNPNGENKFKWHYMESYGTCKICDEKRQEILDIRRAKATMPDNRKLFMSEM